MKKITLVYDHLGTIHSNLELPLYLEYFNVEQYQIEKTYNPKTTLYYTDALKKTNVHDEFLARGFQIVYDGLHEPGIKFGTTNGYVLHHQDYMWYHESLQMIAHNYHTYQPQKTYKKLALMPMNLQKPHRTQLLENMVAHLDECYWSYAALGRQLPFDVILNWQGQRHFDPRWYDDTYFSIVAETRIRTEVNTPLLISEKTFKALAFYHPFLIWGEPGSLQHLKKLGFETFGNLFDESYDTIVSPSVDRLKTMVSNVGNFKRVQYDSITLEKLQHNHNRFFDQAYVQSCIKQQIIEPLLQQIETTL